MKIENSQLNLRATHQSEHQTKAFSFVQPGGTESFYDLFALLRSTGAGDAQNDAGNGGLVTEDSLGLLENIAGARNLAAEDDRQGRVKRLLEELFAALEALVMQMGEGESADSKDLTAQLGQAVRQDGGADGQWTKCTLIREEERECLAICGRGCVRTADGKEIDFQLDLSMFRETVTTRLDWSSGSHARLVDPLVLNFPGQAAELTGATIGFDLTGDGVAEKLPLLAGGSGYLAFDRNGDGQINEGGELFGTDSGNGFADLAQLDADGNRWLDAGDSAFAQLLLWRPDAMGAGELTPLADLGVGALALSSVFSSFDFKDGDGNLQAALRRTGLWLGESGAVGSLQQLDVAA